MNKDIIIKYLIYLFSMVFIDNSGISEMQVSVLTVLLVLDVFTGVLKAYFCKGGNSIRSKAFYAGITSKFLIWLLPVVFQLFGNGVGVDFSLLVSILYCFLIGNEVYSFLNNTLSIMMRKNLKEYDSLGMLMMLLRNFVLRFLEITKEVVEHFLENVINLNAGGINEVKEEKEETTKTL